MLKLGKKTSRFLWRHKRAIIVTFILLLTLLGIFSYLTNPFTHFSIIDKNIINVSKHNEEIQVSVDEKIYVMNNRWYRQLAQAKSGWHILINRLDPRIATFGSSVDEIITNVHNDRFSPDNPFLISGEHFSVLYPRSLGIFYSSLLDPRTALNQEDWEKKQIIYLKTLTFLIETFKESNSLSTTIVPIFPKTVTLINIYAPPSDTLYSILFALYSTQSDAIQKQVYPYKSDNSYKLQTTSASKKLVADNKESLQRLTQQYLEYVQDTNGLVKKDVILSSTKDSVKRQSSFYDNVILWKTIQLAQNLSILEKNPKQLADLKEKIIATYWLKEEGYFLEEVSEQAIREKWYSSDWLIAYETGFLDPKIKRDRDILVRSVSYITKNNIDQPFGMRYQLDVRPQQLHRTVRLFARTYGSTAIWSHWGMEYIKLLVRLAQETGNEAYLVRAEYQLKSYQDNIEEYGGFPEVYESEGEIFRTRFYRGITSTGWIVNFEQANAMLNWTKNNWHNFVKNEVK